MIKSLEFPKDTLPDTFTAKKIRTHFSEEDRVKLEEVISEINGYLKDSAHLSIDKWKFDVVDCSRRTRIRLVQEFNRRLFTAEVDKYTNILSLSVPKIPENKEASDIQKRIHAIALRQFTCLSNSIPAKIRENSNALLWHCIIYDTSETIVEKLKEQIEAKDRGFQVVKHQQTEEACGKRFYRTKQILEIRDPSRKLDEAWQDPEVMLEFFPDTV